MRSRAPRKAASPAAYSRAAAPPSEPSTPTTIVSMGALTVIGTITVDDANRPKRAVGLSSAAPDGCQLSSAPISPNGGPGTTTVDGDAARRDRVSALAP